MEKLNQVFAPANDRNAYVVTDENFTAGYLYSMFKPLANPQAPVLLDGKPYEESMAAAICYTFGAVGPEGNPLNFGAVEYGDGVYWFENHDKYHALKKVDMYKFQSINLQID